MTVLDSRDEWWTHAACLTVDPDLFFPVSARGRDDGQAARAKAVCGRCPVRARCLSYALAAGGGVQGIWGGLSEGERLALRRRQRKAQAREAARSS